MADGITSDGGSVISPSNVVNPVVKKSFRISDVLELKLKNNKTNIYVNGKLFNQCKNIIFNILKEDVQVYDSIDSIDEAAGVALEIEELYGKESRENFILPLDEFWGHCSNLKAWVENDYDTRLLHSNLAFPLLRKLGEFDEKAKNRFSEELVKRWNSGYEPVQEYIIEVYKKELFTLPKEYIDSIEFNNIKIRELDLDYNKLGCLPDSIGELKNLETLYLRGNKLECLPVSIGELKNLETLYLSHNNLGCLPDSIGELKNLEYLNLDYNKLGCLPDSIGKLESLKTLYLDSNELKELPDSIGKLESLKTLYLYNNKLGCLPDSIGNLKSLKYLNLRGNKLGCLPDSIGEFKSLEYLNLRGNKLGSLPGWLKALKKKGIAYY